MDWTCRQDAILRERCHEGVHAVQQAILEECGVEHTVRAIEAHASRVHVSLRRKKQCPQCGAIGVRINRQSRMCLTCTEKAHVAEEEAYNAMLKLEAAGCDGGPEYEEAKRRYAQLRQQNSRLMRVHGLKGKREREAS